METQPCPRCRGQISITETTEDHDRYCLQCGWTEPIATATHYEDEAITALAAHVVKNGLAEFGPQYATDEDGAFWVSLMGLDPALVAELAEREGFTNRSHPAAGVYSTFPMTERLAALAESSQWSTERRIRCSICHQAIVTFFRSKHPSQADIAEAKRRITNWHTSETGQISDRMVKRQPAQAVQLSFAE